MRLLAVLFFFCAWLRAMAVDLYDHQDAWEYYNLASVVSSSAYIDSTGTTFDPRDLFGGTFSSQESGSGHYAFGDFVGTAGLTTNTVIWESAHNLPLTAYKVAMAMDGAIRGCSHFTLKGWDSTNSVWVPLDDYIPLYVSVANPNHYGPVSETNRPLSRIFVGKKFYAEIVDNPDNLGSRVIEIDAVTAPDPEPPTLEIRSPEDGASYKTSDVIPISFKASDPQGIEMVEVFSNGQRLYTGGAEDSFTWSTTFEGTYTLEFRAYDNFGGETIKYVSGTVNATPLNIKIENFQASSDTVSFSVTGLEAGRTVVVEASPDLRTWNEIRTDFAADTSWLFSEPKPPGPARFYRARAQ